MEARLLTVLLREEARHRQTCEAMRHMHAVCLAEPCPSHIAAKSIHVDAQTLVTSQVTSRIEAPVIDKA